MLEPNLDRSLAGHFKVLPDPRCPVNRRHTLGDIIVLSIAAVLCGADGWVEIEPRRVGRRLLVCAASVRIYVDRSGPAGENAGRAGPDVREESTCRISANQGTGRSLSADGLAVLVGKLHGRRRQTHSPQHWD